MLLVGTLYIRNVPDDVVGRLKGIAAANGRSLNAEVVVCLIRAAAAREADVERLERFEARRARMSAALADVSPTPEELIRQDRDSR